MDIRHNVKSYRRITEAAYRTRHPDDIILIAVTKSVKPNDSAINAGVVYWREQGSGFLERRCHSRPGKRHFIGTLQTNKVKYIIDRMDLIHSLDRLTLARD